MKNHLPIFNGPPTTPHKQDTQPFFTVRNQGGSDGPVEILIYDRIGKDVWDDSGIADKQFAEILNGIPKDRAITLRINSQGGSVKDGLGIYNRLLERKSHVTAIIDGYAVSTASWIALAANKVIIPENGAMMIHNPSTMAFGESKDLRKVADIMDQHKAMIVSMYRTKTGKADEEISKAMDAETWFIGNAAKEWGLADEVKESIPINNSFDLSSFRRVPGAIAAQMHNSAVLNGGAKNNEPKENMNREKMIALLKKHGATVDNAATDEQLFAQLETVMNAAKAAPATADAAAQLATITADIANLKRVREDERKAFVSQRVDNLINEGKVLANEREISIEQAVANDKLLDVWAKREPQKPGAEPIGNVVDIRADASTNDIAKAFKNNFKAPTDSFMRGNSVSMADIRNASVAKANFYRKHAGRLGEVLNTNTVDTELKRHTILQEIIVDFVRRLAPLNMFSTVFQNVPLQGTDKVEVPFYDLDTSSSTAFVSGTGYTTVGNTTTDNREIMIGEDATDGDRIYQSLSFTSQEISRQPYLNIVQLNRLKAEKLASDIFTDVLGIVTNANYGAAAKISPANMFDSDDIADLVAACETWPSMGRGLMLDTAYHANLLKDPSFKHALNAASDLAIKEGRLSPRVMGFDYTEIPTIPTNSENLVGFAFFKSAILVATAPVPPSEEVRNAGTVWELVTDPQTGISFEYRRFGNNVTDAAMHIIECSYGFAKGNGNALKRVTSA